MESHCYHTDVQAVLVLHRFPVHRTHHMVVALLRGRIVQQNHYTLIASYAVDACNISANHLSFSSTTVCIWYTNILLGYFSNNLLWLTPMAGSARFGVTVDGFDEAIARLSALPKEANKSIRAAKAMRPLP